MWSCHQGICDYECTYLAYLKYMWYVVLLTHTYTHTCVCRIHKHTIHTCLCMHVDTHTHTHTHTTYTHNTHITHTETNRHTHTYTHTHTHTYTHSTCTHTKHCTLLGVQVTAGLGFFSVFRSSNLVKTVTPCSISFSFLAGAWWDSEIETWIIENTHRQTHTYT